MCCFIATSTLTKRLKMSNDTGNPEMLLIRVTAGRRAGQALRDVRGGKCNSGPRFVGELQIGM